MEITKARYKYNQRPHKQVRAKFVAIILSAFVLAASSSGYAYAAFAKEIPGLSITPTTPPDSTVTPIAMPWPAVGQAAMGSLQDGVLATSSVEEQVKPIASMTKVITALAIMQKNPYALGESGQTYTFTADDVAIYKQYIAKNGAVVPVEAGQTLTQYQAMQAMLLASANNLADSLAIRNFGTMDGYITYANNMIKSFGLTKTTISDASGFSPQTVSTPSELITIGQKVLADPVVAGIVSQKQADIPGIGIVRNTNKLLSDERVIGIKTGTTDEAGSCLLFASNHAIDQNHSVTMIGVIMGDNNGGKVYTDARALLDAAASGFAAVQAVAAGTIVGTAHSVWGEGVDLVTKEDVTIYSWKGKTFKSEVSFNELTAPVQSSQVVGKLSIVGSKQAVDVVASKPITEPSKIWRLANLF